jgi:hypothetical protein
MDLFTVTTLGPEKDGTFHDTTVAICTSLGRAQAIIENDEGGFYEEGYYPLAVIERKPADTVYPCAHSSGDGNEYQWWYQYQEGRGYVSCPRPEEYKGIIGFCC